MRWTAPADLRAQGERLWSQGRILASLVTGDVLFPLRLVMTVPNAADMVDHFDQVRIWVQALRAMPHCRFEMREFRHRTLGRNAVPAQAWIDSLYDAAGLVGKQGDVAVFKKVLEVTTQRQPEWLAWLAQKPLVALELVSEWPRFLDIAVWCRNHPRAGVYVRQVDIPGIHSKYIEMHRGVLGELIELVLPAWAIDTTASGVGQFNRRFGFREKPVRIRIRSLDPAALVWPGDDIAITADAFVKLDPAYSHVFITENEINFLAFPHVPNSLIIFGAGYGVESLRAATWLSQRQIFYWGDIDTHGFTILDQLRQHFPDVSSFLMDRSTLMASAEHWVHEATQALRDLTRLTRDEKALFDDLRDNRLGKNVRLEQERIAFGRVIAALHDIGVT